MVEMKDSGERQVFEGGAMRDSAKGKPKMHFLSPHMWNFFGGEPVKQYLLTLDISHVENALFELCEIPDLENRLCNWLEKGAEKYDEWNWAKGMPFSRVVDSLGRHMRKIVKGDEAEDHHAAKMCNMMFLIHYHLEVMAGRLSSDWLDLWNFAEGRGAEVMDLKHSVLHPPSNADIIIL